MTFLALVMNVLSSAAQDGSGVIVGKLELPESPKRKRVPVEKYAGSISGRVAPPPQRVAGVWLTRQGLTAGNPRDIAFNQKGYQFESSLLIVPLHTTVYFPNEDPDYHNVFSLSRSKRFDLGRYKPGERPPPSVTFDKPGLIQLRCEIHEHMQATVLVVDSPFTTLTDSKGRFQLRGVPSGTYTLHARWDKKTAWRMEVTVIAGRTVTANPARREAS